MQQRRAARSGARPADDIHALPPSTNLVRRRDWSDDLVAGSRFGAWIASRLDVDEPTLRKEMQAAIQRLDLPPQEPRGRGRPRAISLNAYVVAYAELFARLKPAREHDWVAVSVAIIWGGLGPKRWSSDPALRRHQAYRFRRQVQDAYRREKDRRPKGRGRRGNKTASKRNKTAPSRD
jgi:hypothetical protein